MTGSNNSFFGFNAGYNHANGTMNTFVGSASGYAASTGNNNCFMGFRSGYNNTGNYNTFIGNDAGLNNTLSINNTFIGSAAGQSNTTGSNNTYLGYASRGYQNLTNATAIGSLAYVTASNCMVLGSIADTPNGATENTNVGIGTTTPNNRLEITTTAFPGTSGLRLTLLQTPTANTTTALTVDGNGDVILANVQGGGADADADPTNELQTVSQAGNIVTLSNGGGSFTVNDADADPTNEIQTLSFTSPNLTISNGNSVDLSPLITVTNPALPVGSVQFNNNNIFGGNPNFIWDNSSQRLGVGTSNPAAKIEVFDNSGLVQQRLSYSSTVFTNFQTRPNGNLFIDPHNGTMLGNVGISTGKPNAKVDIYSNSTSLPHLRLSYKIGLNPIYADFRTTDLGDLFINPMTGSNPRYVGIGVMNPSQKLDVDGNTRIRGITSGTNSGIVTYEDNNPNSVGTLHKIAFDLTRVCL